MRDDGQAFAHDFPTRGKSALTCGMKHAPISPAASLTGTLPSRKVTPDKPPMAIPMNGQPGNAAGYGILAVRLGPETPRTFGPFCVNLARHCEKRSDEAIQSPARNGSGLLRPAASQ